MEDSKQDKLKKAMETRGIMGAKSADEVPVKRPVRCRVRLTDRMMLPIVGSGANAFDADFNWDGMYAIGVVEGYTIIVGVQQAVIAFYK